MMGLGLRPGGKVPHAGLRRRGWRHRPDDGGRRTAADAAGAAHVAPNWAITGNAEHKTRLITSLYLGAQNLEALNLRLQKKLALIKQNEVRWQEYRTDDAELLLIAYGTVGRICLSVMREARQQGLKVGLLRPQTLWPFPKRASPNSAGQVFAASWSRR